MKKFLLAATASLVGLAAFGQGRISFQTDSLHLAYYYGWGPYSGQAVYDANMPYANLVADLYMGTASSSLSYISTATFSSTPGKWNTVNVVAPFPGGTSVFVQTLIRDSTFTPLPTYDPDWGLFGGSGGLWGFSSEFTFTLGSSIITYPVMYGANGTWPVGTFSLDQYGAGFRGAIGIGLIPEPSVAALISVAGAALLLRRFRK